MINEDRLSSQIIELLQSSQNCFTGIATGAQQGGVVSVLHPSGYPVTAIAATEVSPGECVVFRNEDGNYYAVAPHLAQLESESVLVYKRIQQEDKTLKEIKIYTEFVGLGLSIERFHIYIKKNKSFHFLLNPLKKPKNKYGLDKLRPSKSAKFDITEDPSYLPEKCLVVSSDRATEFSCDNEYVYYKQHVTENGKLPQPINKKEIVNKEDYIVSNCVPLSLRRWACYKGRRKENLSPYIGSPVSYFKRTKEGMKNLNFKAVWRIIETKSKVLQAGGTISQEGILNVIYNNGKLQGTVFKCGEDEEDKNPPPPPERPECLICQNVDSYRTLQEQLEVINENRRIYYYEQKEAHLNFPEVKDPNHCQAFYDRVDAYCAINNGYPYGYIEPQYAVVTEFTRGEPESSYEFVDSETNCKYRVITKYVEGFRYDSNQCFYRQDKDIRRTGACKEGGFPIPNAHFEYVLTESRIIVIPPESDECKPPDDDRPPPKNDKVDYYELQIGCCDVRNSIMKWTDETKFHAEIL